MELSIEHLRKMRERYLWNGVSEVTAVLDELIAIRELKGDQVPVGYIHGHQLAALKDGNTTIVKPNSAFGETVELFTTPQKPVVLPKEIEPWEVIDILDPTANPEDYACCVGADMYNAAIKACRRSVQAAGGIVKDGE